MNPLTRRDALALTFLPLAAAASADATLPAPGHWLELPGTALEKVFPPQSGHPAWGVIGPRAVTDAWGGAAWDDDREVLVLTGGGHADYGGNEVYEFDLARRRWSRVTEPSPLRPLGQGRFESAGPAAPVSSHTYDGLVHVPTLGGIFKFGGSYYLAGNAYDRHAWLFDLRERRWRRLAEAPQAWVEVSSDLDAEQARVIVGTGTGLLFYDVAADRWTAAPQRNAQASASNGVLDPVRRLFVLVQDRDGALEHYRLADPAARLPTPLRGEQPWGRRPGMAWDARRRQLVLWAGGREVWAVDTALWAVKPLAASGSAPQATFADGRRRSAGLYSRWQYLPRRDLFIGVQHAGDNVWLYRPPD